MSLMLVGRGSTAGVDPDPVAMIFPPTGGGNIDAVRVD
jgi:hypothetical protein